MQTFLPIGDPTFTEDLRALDPSRLGNQVYREAKTLANGGWARHPTARMWQGHRYKLLLYVLKGLDVLNVRGRYYPHHYDWVLEQLEVEPRCELPDWYGDERLHSSHRAALLYKDPEWYGKFGWKETPTGPGEDGKWRYWWPV